MSLNTKKKLNDTNFRNHSELDTIFPNKTLIATSTSEGEIELNIVSGIMLR